MAKARDQARTALRPLELSVSTLPGAPLRPTSPDQETPPALLDLSVALHVPTLLDLTAALHVPALLDLTAALHVPALLDLTAALHVPALLDLTAALHLPVLPDLTVALQVPVLPDLSVALQLPARPGAGAPPRLPAPRPAWDFPALPVLVPPVAPAPVAAPAASIRAAGVVPCREASKLWRTATTTTAGLAARVNSKQPAGPTQPPSLPSQPTPHGTSERAAGGAASGAPMMGALLASWHPGAASAHVPRDRTTAARGRTVNYAGPPS
ncbi:hypothetical protein AB0M36_05565 [Actinoplanes sp. NPDC051346]|uniref:hypothetical protein n=1 Tax=Actinoplanes sp. NPDC051346 TaxID=3155048 RepID=UPI003428C146